MVAFNALGMTAHEVLHGLKSGHFTSRDVVEKYLKQVHTTNARLRAVLETAPTALAEAETCDSERREGMIRGPLHGLPVLLKASIATDSGLQMETTSGNFALSGSRPRQNADVVQKLLKAGAIIIGKASLSELSYWKIHLIPAGWSPAGGQGQNAYVRGGRQLGELIFTFNGPGGSSSGPAIGVSAGFAPVSIGTETSGSLILPADRAALYTIKPTVGVIPQGGLVPVSLRFDIAGPMAKCSRDIALFLDLLVDGTKAQVPSAGYLSCAVGRASWSELKVGVLDTESWLHDEAVVGYADGQKQQIIREVSAAYEKIRTEVKELRHVTIESCPDGASVNKNIGPLMGKLFEYDYRRDFESYLSTVDNSHISSLKDVLTNNDMYSVLALPEGQGGREALERAISCKITEQEALTIDAEMRDLSRTRGIDRALKNNDVNVLLGPACGRLYMLAAAAGYPIATLPLSYLDSNGCPFGLVALASAHQESLLVSIQAAWEDTFPPKKSPTVA